MAQQTRSCGLFLALVVTWLAAPSAARADLLTPSGNPTGPSRAVHSTFFFTYNVDLSPTAATLATWHDPPEGAAINPLWWALDAQGLNGANGWTINFFDLEGDFTLVTYEAWAETKPAVAAGGMAFPAVAAPGSGGAAFALGYNPQGMDPTGGDVHWIQVIETNSPLNNPNGIYQGELTGDPSIVWYIDDAPNDLAVEGPFYDAHFAANSTAFIDIPSRAYSDDTFWYAHTFIATGDLAGQVLNISYQSVGWGFVDPIIPAQAVPEPSTFLLLSCGAGALLLFRQRWSFSRRS